LALCQSSYISFRLFAVVGVPKSLRNRELQFSKSVMQTLPLTKAKIFTRFSSTKYLKLSMITSLYESFSNTLNQLRIVAVKKKKFLIIITLHIHICRRNLPDFLKHCKSIRGCKFETPRVV
jgi:hypothetical protein